MTIFQHCACVKFDYDVDFYQYTDVVCHSVPQRLLALTVRKHRVKHVKITLACRRPPMVDLMW